MTSPDMLREVIREVVRDVIREVIAEEMAAVALSQASGTNQASTRATPPAPRASAASGVLLDRGALTERHVRSAGDAKSITIGSKVVITPLARERARTMGIEIIRVSVEG
ncbi:MAG: hypothetical protein FJW80_00570 [Actinobacteria bacterium]|nr:hypothetical protein [Actinomycetota bacterium]